MKKKNTKEIRKLRLKVLKLYDEFTQFSDQCAFLCDSFSAIPTQQEFIEPQTIGGIHFYSRWLKTRVLEIKSELRQVHEQLRELKEL
jgi:hypothetical protein